MPTKTTDEPTITVTSTFRRVKQPAQYETATAEITVSETFVGSVSPEDVANQAMSQFEVIKSEVFQQLGIDFEQDEATGRIMEIFPNAVVVESHPSQKPKAPARRLRPVKEEEPPIEAYEDDEHSWHSTEPQVEEEPAPVRRAPRAPKAAPASNQRRQPARRNAEDDPDGHWQDLMENPGDWWNNQENKRNPKGPDFAHKSKKRPGTNFPIGLWLGQDTPEWFRDPYS